ncbi:MAG: TetR/AcrR family transcriptional regulator [Butyrivibrio sp.]|nr:TetR/AcrR family transcriptional regulator [Butyrivibrio sp.]
MNEKFFDVKKEKQDRMINASLKVFALNGYIHASTDDIVREAGVSKGLLFHYFVSKIGLYTFLYDYAKRFLSLEVSTRVNKKETDAFVLMEQLKDAEVAAMQQYPYIQLFLKRAENETCLEALEAVSDSKSGYHEMYESIMRNQDVTRFVAGADYVKVEKMLNSVMDNILPEYLNEDSFNPSRYLNEVNKYIDMMRELCYYSE